MKQTLFVSSVQKELAEERRAIRDFVRNDPLLRQFFDVFLFEDIPASDRRADDVYLSQVDRCGLYVGLYGMEYGLEDREGCSPTEREFQRATEKNRPRLIFVKGADDKGRHPKMTALIRKVGDQLVRRRFTDVDELKTALNASLVAHLQRQGMIQTQPFEEQVCAGASLGDIDDKAVAAFVRRARNERRFPLAESASVVDVLTHLHLLDEAYVSNAAILLFGRDPQRFMACAEVRCMHFHGTEIQRPVPFYQIFKGNLFEQVDKAVDFVLSKVNRSVGTRAEGPRAPVRYELPEDVVAEAIVNAVVHRDYASSGAIQVSVFSDRVEIWNPGELLPPLTAESLRKPHRSILRNTRIAEALYLAHYIEKYGTGTLMMIRESMDYALPEPRFGTNEPGEFGVTVWRDWLTEEALGELGLSDSQKVVLLEAKTGRGMSNRRYCEITGCSASTALRELRQLANLGILNKIGGTGRSAHYMVAKAKPVINPPNPSSGLKQQTRHKPVKPVRPKIAKGSKRPQNAVDSPIKRVINAPVVSLATSQVGTKLGLSRDQVEILHKCMTESSIGELMALAGRSNRSKFRDQVVKPLLTTGLLDMTLPTKPTSRNQKYSLTEKGRQFLTTLHNS